MQPELIEDDKLGKAFDARLTRRLFTYVRPYRMLALAALVLLCVEGALQLAAPALTKLVIDVALPSGDVRLVWLAAGLFFAVLLIQFACSYGETILTSLLGQKVMRDIRTDVFAHLQKLPIPFFARNPVGRLMTRVTSDVEALNELLTAGVVAGLGDLFTLAAISVAMLVLDWRLALAAFFVIPFVVIVSALFRKKVRETYREIRVRLARINAFLQEKLTGVRVVQLFGEEEREYHNFDRLNREHLDWHLRSITVYALYFPAIEILAAIALASLLLAGRSAVGTGTLTVGTVAAFLMLVRRFFQPLQDLSEKYNLLQGAMAASERIFKLLDEPAGPSGLPGAGDTAVAKAALSTDRQGGVTVEFRGVWFAYDSAQPGGGGAPLGDAGGAGRGGWVLEDVSFTARPGETVAIVGHTGAGKTTTINLLLRFYEPQRGSIFINGVDIRSIPVRELRGLIGYVQQDIFIFAGDIESNIRLSQPLSREEVERAARSVGAHRFISRLPGGYAREVGERGASLSVGERQLLSFARAIVADPRLLLLDEATSSVDSELEAEIQEALSTLMRGRTTVAIAHRLSTIARADTILVMHHGKIVERGTHQQLLRLGGLYDRLYRLQIVDENMGPTPSAALETTYGRA